MTRLLTAAAALLLATGVAHAQMSPAPNATAPANPATAGTAMQRGTMPMPAPAPAPMPAPMPAASAAPAKPVPHHAARRHGPAAHPMKHTAGGRATGRGAPREQGSAAVDALNEQSLARARGGQ